MSFQSLITTSGGELIFASKQDDIQHFLSGPMMNYEGVCLALVLMWFEQDTSKLDPSKGTANKARAMNLQNGIQASWQGFPTAVAKATEILTAKGKHFWYKSETMNGYVAEKLGAEVFLQHDPQNNRESLSIFAIYFPETVGHAIGVWRFPNVMALYDPNHGACAIKHEAFRGFLNRFLTELYSTTNGYAVCAFHS
jgi:hypothetical protein